MISSCKIFSIISHISSAWVSSPWNSVVCRKFSRSLGFIKQIWKPQYFSVIISFSRTLSWWSWNSGTLNLTRIIFWLPGVGTGDGTGEGAGDGTGEGTGEGTGDGPGEGDGEGVGEGDGPPPPPEHAFSPLSVISDITGSSFPEKLIWNPSSK